MRIRPIVHGILAFAVAASVWRARSATGSDDGLPTWDSAGYLLSAETFREKLVATDWSGALQHLLKPDLHPPLHTAFLGLFLALFGNSFAVARAWPTLCFVVSLGLITELGRRLVRDGGLAVGLGAALLTALGLGNLTLLATPMTESTGLWTELLALLVAVHVADRRDAGAQLGLGAAVLAATLVRFNMAPMLLAPLYLQHAWRFRRSLRELLDPRTLLWAAPTVVALVAWQLERPELSHNIEKFFENRSSGLAFWSAENLLWVPLSLHSAYLPWLGPLLLVPFFAGLRTETSPGMRRLQLFVLVSFAALTWHDFKITRNLATVVPVYYLTALAPLARLSWRRGAVALTLALSGCAYGAWQHATTLVDLPTKSDYLPDPTVRAALEFIQAQGSQTRNTWVVGWVFRLSPGLIDTWMRMHDAPTKVRLEMPNFGEETRTGVNSPWSAEYPAYVQEKMFTPALLGSTTYVAIDVAPGSRYYDGWKSFGAHYARALREQTVVPEVDHLDFPDAGLTLRVYRAGGATAARDVAAPVAEPTARPSSPPTAPPEPAAPLAAAPGWALFPPDAPGVTLDTTAGVVVTTTAAAPHVQACGPTLPYSGTMRALVRARPAGVQGRGWVHLRAMDAAGKLVAPGAIVQVGPLTGDTPVDVQRPLPFPEGTTSVKPCLVLDNVEGTVTLESLSLETTK